MGESKEVPATEARKVILPLLGFPVSVWAARGIESGDTLLILHLRFSASHCICFFVSAF